jgi:hypothetical protein
MSHIIAECGNSMNDKPANKEIELSQDQSDQVEEFYHRVNDCIYIEAQQWYKTHPELWLEWALTMTAHVREVKP